MSPIKIRTEVDLHETDLVELRLSLGHVEEQLEKSILKAALALYILKNSREPASKLVRDLLQMEIEVGKFVGQVLEMRAGRMEVICQEGLLASTLSFIPAHSPKD